MRIRHLSPLLSLLFVLIWAGYSVPSASAWVKSYGYHKGHGHSHYGYHRSRYDKHYGHHRYGHHKYPRYYRYDRGRYDRYKYRYQHDKYGEPGRHGRSYDAHGNRRKEAEKHSDGYAGSSAGLSRGWEFLRNGDASGALHRFSTAARANPSSGVPKVGYALAAAELGRLEKAAWAMRRALRVDPEALRYANEYLLPQYAVDHLIGSYKNSGLYKNQEGDAYFMLAALAYIQDEHEASRHWIRKSGDNTAGTRNLVGLIEESSSGIR